MAVKFTGCGLAELTAGRAHSAASVIAKGGRAKPAPDVFLAAARGVPANRCVVLEDSALGVTGAVAAGMVVYGFDGMAAGRICWPPGRARFARSIGIFGDFCDDDCGLVPFYHWELALHVISFTAWMAGLFYLPRLYVYHCQVPVGSTESARFKVMERRLLKQITTPAMIATWLFGILLVLTPGAVDWGAAWWWTKLVCVILMSGFTGACSKWRSNFLNDANEKRKNSIGLRMKYRRFCLW